MLTRRGLAILGCCSLHVAFGRYSTAQPSGWICSATDGSPQADAVSQPGNTPETPIDRQRIEEAQREFGITPYGTSLFRNRWRRSDGMTPNTGLITLGVHFLNGSDGAKEKVRSAANRWIVGDLANLIKFRFDVPRKDAQISVNTLSDRNNSLVGRESASWVRIQETMNLHDLNDEIVMHEFGHALGLDHEHQNQGAAIRWDEQAVIADMAKQGWTPEMCRLHIFSRFSADRSCVVSGSYDNLSIMRYPIPSGWNLDRIDYTSNYTLSKGDQSCIVGIYKA